MAPGMQQVEEWKRQVRMIGSGIHQMLVGYLGEEEKDMNKRGEAVINDSPDIVKNVYRCYLQAGCDVLCTCTHHLAPQGGTGGLNQSTVTKLMSNAVKYAQQEICALTEALDEQTTQPIHPRMQPLIAGALGPHATCRCVSPSKESFKIEKIDSVYAFHEKRAQILTRAGVDLLAWENIPSVAEVVAIVKVMNNFPKDYPAWITVASTDGKTTLLGEDLEKAGAAMKQCNRIFGIGVNCNIEISKVKEAFKKLMKGLGEEAKEKILIAYPSTKPPAKPTTSDDVTSASQNEDLDTDDSYNWVGQMQEVALLRCQRENNSDSAIKLSHDMVRAQWSGGCCYVTPKMLSKFAPLVRMDDIEYSERCVPYKSKRASSPKTNRSRSRSPRREPTKRQIKRTKTKSAPNAPKKKFTRRTKCRR